MLVLPDLDLTRRQPRIPSVARVIIRRAIPNEHGTPIVFTVHVARNGREWWISASFDGMRMSGTLHTTTRKTATAWIAAVNSGRVCVRRLHEEKTDTELDREIDEALAKLHEKRARRG
jgi:hypothetical protein